MKRKLILSLILLVCVGLLYVAVQLINHATTAQAAMISSAQSGPWSDASTWSNNSVPTTGDMVTINAGHTVVYDVVSDDVLGEVMIHGTLYFSRETDTRLKTNDNIMVMDGGFLDMGTPDDFILRNLKAEVIWQLTQAQANAYMGGFNFEPTDKGLWAMSGSRWEVHGAPLVRTWSKLVANANAGSTNRLRHRGHSRG